LAILALVFFMYKRLKGRFSSAFKLQALPILPIVVMLLALIGYRLLEVSFGIRTFNTLAFLFFIFGYLGLYVDQAAWLKSAIPILLLTLILPFGDLLDTYLGFPLRMQTSNVVEHIVRKMGIDLVDHQTILSLENRYTQVDTTCSGLNVIWAGTLLFIAYSIIDKLRFGLRWILLFFTFIAMLLFFNGARVLILVLLELVLENQRLANVIHLPLGLVGFVIPAIVLWFLVNKNKRTSRVLIEKVRQPKISFVGQLVVALLLLGLFAFAPHMERAGAKPLGISESLDFEPIALAAKEKAYFDFEGSDARKYKLDYKSLHGSIILVASSSFKGHHDPTLCLQSIGLSIEKNEPRIIDGKPLRYLTFRSSNQVGVYWFKSGNEYTDDYSYRVWYDLQNNNRKNNWLQVTALIDQNYKTTDLPSFFNYINNNVNCNETN